MKRNPRFETALIHAGEPQPRIHGAVAIPIFQSATFENRDGDPAGVRYIRYGNTPNHNALNAKLAVLEGGEAAVVTASGMAAISSTLLAVLAPGDHFIAHRNLYGGTHGFVSQDLARLGIECTFVDGDAPSTWEKARRTTTRAFFVETITNPLLEVIDLEAVVRFCRTHAITSVIDNTLATPVNYRPIERGFDIVLHSATKYLNGHSDIVAGAVVGPSKHIAAIREKVARFGGSIDPHTCFLLHRGIKTLALRVRHQNASALAIARFLEEHPAVSRVHYPGLASHPDSARARAWFEGAGGLISFELHGGVSAAERFFARARIPAWAPSLGGVETLMTRPSLTSHSGLSAEERHRLGISDALVRISIGIESTDDIIEDFTASLGGAG